MKPLHTGYLLLSTLWLMPGTSNAQTSNNSNNNTKKEERMKVNHNNQEIVKAVYESALNQRNMGLLHDLISPEFVGIRGLKGAAGFEEPVAGLIKSFPDIQWKIDELLGEGNKVSLRWTVVGTFTGAPFTTYAANGKKVASEGMAIFELKEGKIISAHVLTDRLGFLQQLDVLPVDLSTLPNRKPQPEMQGN